MSALTHAAVHRDTRSRSIKAGLAGVVSVLPSVAMAALPKIFCPACWPAYSALLGSMGLGFINYSPFMLPLTVLFLLIVVVMLGYNARRSCGYRPFILGTFAAKIVEDLIVSLKGRYTVLMVTHNLAQARRVADAVAVCWMNAGCGCVIETGPTWRVFEAASHPLAAAYCRGESG